MDINVTAAVCVAGRHAVVCTCGHRDTRPLSATGAEQAEQAHQESHYTNHVVVTQRRGGTRRLRART